jgi:decaprenylphospho-beta-D-erythro-pentofuranosid-2-ulose 2-reductase
MATILILGAASDVAISVARKFANEKYDVYLAAKNCERLIPFKSDLTIRYGINCDLYEFNALEFENHGNFISSLPEIPSITLCAFGYLGDEEKARIDFSEAQKIIQTNYVGAVSILNLIAIQYRFKKNGCIIGISSVAGDRGRSSNYMYGSSKAGFTSYLSGLRNDLFHHNVKVITVLPGFIYSKMTAHLHLPKILTSTPEEVSNYIFSAYKKNKNIIYVKWYWQWIMFLIKCIPEFLFKKLKL